MMFLMTPPPTVTMTIGRRLSRRSYTPANVSEFT